MGQGKSSDFTDPGYQPAGIYGWRKQCLYATVLFILIIVIMNLALTVWILRVLDFNIAGLHFGNIKLHTDGIFIQETTEIVKTVHVSTLQGRKGKPLEITSGKGVILQGREDDNITNILQIDKNKIEAACDSFEIRDFTGKTRFKVTEKEVTIGVDEVTYSGKAVFNGSVETPNIRGPKKGSLRLESASSSIVLTGRTGVLLEAPVGDINFKSSQDLSLQANNKIIFNTTNLYMNNIKVSMPTGSGTEYDDVFQLCMCGNGRVFLAPSSGACTTDSDTCK